MISQQAVEILFQRAVIEMRCNPFSLPDAEKARRTAALRARLEAVAPFAPRSRDAPVSLRSVGRAFVFLVVAILILQSW